MESQEWDIRGHFLHGELKTGKMTDKLGNSFETIVDKQNPSASGSFINGKLHGLGKASYMNGDSYKGMFKDGQRSGMGRMEYSRLECMDNAQADEGVYEGMWRLNKRHGEGKMTWWDGCMFTGEWKNDKRYKGEMTMQDGGVYDGYF